MNTHTRLYRSAGSWGRFITNLRHRPNIHSSIQHLPHPAAPLLHALRNHGAPATLLTPPWSSTQLDQAANRGSHSSSLDHIDFVHEEMADMVEKGFWTVLPYHQVAHLPGLRLSPLGVVPQRERRPRIIVDYSFSGVNSETNKTAPRDAMQFGRTLARLFDKIFTAPSRFGPVHMLKLDIADGFYQMRLRDKDIPSLGVILPTLPGHEKLVAFPLVLPMGWTESPPYFCTLTETATDIANTALSTHWDPPQHPLEAVAATTATTPPSRTLFSNNKAIHSLHRHLHHHHHTASRPSRHRHRPQQPLAAVDVFVDDHVALAQGSQQRRSRVRRVLLHAIDAVLRPNDEHDHAGRREPVSIKKLLKGDGRWDTQKVVLGWLIDTVAMTVSLPPHRQERLHHIIDSVKGRSRVSTKKWHQFLGELRSMALAIPGVRGLFSQLQVAFRHSDQHRVRLHAAARDAIDDLHQLATEVIARPTALAEVVPRHPTHIGSTDAAKVGMGGVWIPSKTQTYPPIVWRARFNEEIQLRVVSDENPKGTITNSDLELAGLVAGQTVLCDAVPARDISMGLLTDNTAAMFWHDKGSTTTQGPPAYLLRYNALHQRQHRYQSHVRYIPGPANTMADDASRRFDLNDADLLTHFNSTFPQDRPWQLRQPPPTTLSMLTSALLRKKPSRLSPIGVHSTKMPSSHEHGSPISTPWGSPVPYSPGSKTPSPTYRSLRTASEVANSASAKDLLALRQYLTPSTRWQRRSPAWGPATPDSPRTQPWLTNGSKTFSPHTGMATDPLNGSGQSQSQSWNTPTAFRPTPTTRSIAPSLTWPSSVSSSCSDRQNIPTQGQSQSPNGSPRAPFNCHETNVKSRSQAQWKTFAQPHTSPSRLTRRRTEPELKPSHTLAAATITSALSKQPSVDSHTCANTTRQPPCHSVPFDGKISGSWSPLPPSRKYSRCRQEPYRPRGSCRNRSRQDHFGRGAPWHSCVPASPPTRSN